MKRDGIIHVVDTYNWKQPERTTDPSYDNITTVQMESAREH